MNSNIIGRFDKMVVVKHALDECGNERDRLCRLSVFFLYVSQLAGTQMRDGRCLTIQVSHPTLQKIDPFWIICKYNL